MSGTSRDQKMNAAPAVRKPSGSEREALGQTIAALTELARRPAWSARRGWLEEQLTEVEREFFLADVPPWARALDAELIDRARLFRADPVAFEAIARDPAGHDVGSRHPPPGNLSQDPTAERLAEHSVFCRHMRDIARILSLALQQKHYVVRVRPECFVLRDDAVDCAWGALLQGAVTPQHTRVERMELGWMHGALRGLALPEPCRPGALVTHAYAYFVLQTLTGWPPPANSDSLRQQVEHLRLYAPELPPELVAVARHYLTLDKGDDTTPEACWDAFERALRPWRQARQPGRPHTGVYEIGGDSVYGRRKSGHDNEDAFFAREAAGSVLLGIADGVSTADFGTGRHASQAIKHCLDEDRERWDARLSEASGLTDGGWEAWAEQLIAEFFEHAQARVMGEIERLATRYPAERRAAARTPSSTLVLAVVTGTRVKLGHWGDSRAYRVDADRAVRLTEDHSVRLEHLADARECPDRPFEAMPESAPEAGALTRLVGRCRWTGERFESAPEPISYDECCLSPGDLLLLCTDGLLGGGDASEPDVETRLWERVWNRRAESCREMARQLVRAADDEDGHDNTTAVLLRVTSSALVNTAPPDANHQTLP